MTFDLFDALREFSCPARPESSGYFCIIGYSPGTGEDVSAGIVTELSVDDARSELERIAVKYTSCPACGRAINWERLREIMKLQKEMIHD